MADNDRLDELTADPALPAPAGGTESGARIEQDETGGEARPVTGGFRAREPHDPERTCILSGTKGMRDSLIRLVLGPDGMVAPDIRAKAGGRGAWIGVDRGTLDKALSKGKLKGALARTFKTSAFRIPDDLGERIASALERAALDRLGLEARSGALLTGSERIVDAARKGTVALLLHARDAGEDGSRRLDQAWRVGGGEARGLVLPASRAILSMALGRENVVHIALIAPAAAARVSHALGRWRSFIGRDDAAEPCESPSQGTSAHEQSSEGSGLPDER